MHRGPPSSKGGLLKNRVDSCQRPDPWFVGGPDRWKPCADWNFSCNEQILVSFVSDLGNNSPSQLLVASHLPCHHTHRCHTALSPPELAANCPDGDRVFAGTESLQGPSLCRDRVFAGTESLQEPSLCETGRSSAGLGNSQWRPRPFPEKAAIPLHRSGPAADGFGGE